MNKTNYIKHLNATFILFSKDSRLNPSHISLYMALFQLWNFNRFIDIFYIHRNEVMELAKLGSHTTYHKCLKQLDHWKYIQYLPSHNPFKGSQVRLYNFETSDKQVLYPHHTNMDTSSKQALVSLLNINKHNKTNIKRTPKNENEVIKFFKKEKWSELEAKKFYNYYSGLDWKIGRTKILNWQATAKNWILKAEEFSTKTKKTLVQKTDNLKTTKNKNYNEPL